uniref:DNA-directed RNA polymerase subunit n=1 Tax=Kalanchoe fedtschenkoi TaxID=63787 RepID=A0A7N0ZUE1_KALFE
MEGLKTAETEIVVHAHPSQSNKVHQALKQEMTSLLFKYNEALDGVVLAHSMELASPDAKIISGVVPYFGVRLAAKLLLFSPKKDMLLEGKVEKVSQNIINIVVLGLCSATVSADDIRGEFDFKTKDGEETCYSTRHKSHKIRVGTILRFLVKSWDAETLIISGSMVPKHTGCIRWLELKSKQHATPIRFYSQGSDVDSDFLPPPLKKHRSKVPDASGG